MRTRDGSQPQGSLRQAQGPTAGPQDDNGNGSREPANPELQRSTNRKVNCNTRPRAAGSTLLMRVKRQFAEEVKHRQAEREHTLSLTHGQRYVLRELRILFTASDDEDVRAQINVLEKAFRAPNLTSAVKKELNLIRRNSMTAMALLKALTKLYQQHDIREWLDRQRDGAEQPIPKIVCSEGLV